MSWTPYEADDYIAYPDVESFCRSAAETHPEWLDLEVVGESRRGRPIFLLTVGAAEPGSDGSERGERPAIWLDAGTHASEWAGVSAALYVVSEWLRRLDGGDTSLQQWFRRHDALVVPCISPDGYQALHEGAPFLRSSLRPPAEGKVRTGLDPTDIDGDGRVRMMRWKDPAGSFVEDDDWAPFLRPRRLDDDPEDAYFLCDEGTFVNWDGVEWTEASVEHGVDLNRNFPAHWKPFSMFGVDSGAYPLSEPESRTVVDTFADHPYIGAGLTLHTYTGAILTQPYRPDSPLGDHDVELMELLAEDLVEGTDYNVHNVYPEFMYEDDTPIPGVWADTMSTVFGVPGYTVEIWDPFDHLGVDIEDPASFFQDPDPEKVRRMMRGFTDETDAVAEWRTVEHPQLGEVEVGGLEYLRSLRNPPTRLLESECETVWKMAERLRQALPKVDPEVECESLGDSTHRLRLTLENTGYLPTSGLDHGESLAETPEVSAELELEAGLDAREPASRSLDHAEGWGHRRTGAGRHPHYASLSDGGHRTWIEWILDGEGDVEIAWTAGRAGRGTESLTVEPDTD